MVEFKVLPGISHRLAAEVAPHFPAGLLEMHLAVVVLPEFSGGDGDVAVVTEPAAAGLPGTRLASRPATSTVAIVVTVVTLQMNLFEIEQIVADCQK